MGINPQRTPESRARHPSWVETASMAFPRTFPRVVPLEEGRALVTGGAVGAFTKTEIFDPSIGPTGGFIPAADSPIPLQAHLAASLDNGQVLVGGGAGTQIGDPANIQKRCFIFNPASASWHRTGDLPHATWWLGRNPAIRLRNDRVLVCGGSSPEDAYVANSATGFMAFLVNRRTYVYDPTAQVTFEDNTIGRGRWTEVALMPEAHHFGHFGPVFPTEGAIPLPPALQSYSAGTVDHSLTLVPDGRVLKVGGRHNQPGFFYGTNGVAIFDPERASWTPGTPLPSTSAAEADGGFGGRIYHGAALLRHGLVLITGGNGAKITFIPAATGTPAKFKYRHSLVRRTGLTYDPGSDTWTRTPKLDMLSTRAGHELVRQVDGNAILAIGGRYLDNTALTQPLTEAFNPRLETWTPFATEPTITVAIPGLGTLPTTKQSDFPVRFGAMLDDGRFLSVGGADPTNTQIRLALAKELIPGTRDEERALPEPLVG
jgi:hypothetical protein